MGYPQLLCSTVLSRLLQLLYDVSAASLHGRSLTSTTFCTTFWTGTCGMQPTAAVKDHHTQQHPQQQSYWELTLQPKLEYRAHMVKRSSGVSAGLYARTNGWL
jgi:hypothetical protein